MGAALADSDRPFVLASGLLGLNPGAGRHRGRRARSRRRGPVQPGRASGRPPHCSHSRYGASVFARPCCASLRPSTATVTTVSWPHSSALPASPGVAGYVGDGSNRWPAVHRSDAARLARLAVEAAPAGSVLHAVGDEGVPFRQIADAMGRHLDIPTASVAPADAAAHFAPFGHFVGLDCPADGRHHPGTARLGADRAQLARRPRPGPLLPAGVDRPRSQD